MLFCIKHSIEVKNMKGNAWIQTAKQSENPNIEVVNVELK